MKNLLFVLCAIALTGCAPKYIVKPDIVEVKTPVLYCPALEEIIPLPPIELESVKLYEDVQAGRLKCDPATPDCAAQVARAYHIDMINLTQRLSELNRLEAQRQANTAEMRKQLEQYQVEIDRIHKENMEKVQTEVLEKQKALNSQ